MGFSNCYILGTDFPSGKDAAAPPREAALPREAVLIDPGNINPEMLNLIESNSYKLKGILITHDHPHHVQGLRTITKIYGTKIYSINSVISEQRTVLVRDGESIKIGPFRTEVISVPGHSADSVIYKIGRFLFTGDVLSAGMVGTTSSSYAAATQAAALRSKILSLPGDYTIWPGHGPPTTLEAERRFNWGINSVEVQKTRRQSFRFDE